MIHNLIELPYAPEALDPVISKSTIEFHHGKHLQGYVNTLNTLIKDTEFENMTLEEIVAKSSGAIFNNAGQTLNHNLYFLQFSPDGGGKPSGKLAEAIDKKWGSFENFAEEFGKAAVTLFGAGWAWLAKTNDGDLVITQYQNAGNPVKDGNIPILGIDVWEHAYYLSYQNRRADHVKDFWKIVNWNVVEKRF